MSDPHCEPEAAPVSRQRRRLRLVGIVLLTVVSALALPVLIVYLKINLEERSYRKHIRKLASDYEAALPVVPDSENAALLYEEALRLFVPASGDCVLRKPPEPPTEDLLKYIAANRPFLEKMREAASRPKCRFATKLDEKFEEVAAGAERWTSPTVFLGSAAMQAAFQGQGDESLEITRTYLRFSGHFGTRGFLGRFGQTVHETIFTSHLPAEFKYGRPGEAATEALLSALDQHVANRPPLEHGVRDLEIRSLFILAGMLGGSAAYKNMTGEELPLSQWGEFHGMRLTGTTLGMGRVFEESWDRSRQALRLPYPQALDELNRLKKGLYPDDSKWAIWSQLWSQKALDVATQDASALAGVQGARLGTACYLYRLQKGVYPASLDELKASFPEHFRELPADPFTGKPFFYKADDSSIKIWSVGEDRKNNDGDGREDIVFTLTRQ